MAKPHDVTVVMEGPNTGKVTVDGMPLCVKSFEVSASKDQITELTVTIFAATVNKSASAGGIEARAFDPEKFMKEIDDKINERRRRMFADLVDDIRKNGAVAHAIRGLRG